MARKIYILMIFACHFLYYSLGILRIHLQPASAVHKVPLVACKCGVLFLDAASGAVWGVTSLSIFLKETPEEEFFWR